MCECGKSVEEALIALDGSINALVMARIILERHAQPVDKAVDKGVDNVCQHTSLLDVSTMGHQASLCNDCGEQL